MVVDTFGASAIGAFLIGLTAFRPWARQAAATQA